MTDRTCHDELDSPSTSARIGSTPRDSRDDRGQSTLDFLLGAVIFLLVLAMVVAFVPGLFDPFVDGGEAQPVVADRAVSTLLSHLSVGETPGVTNSTQVDAVFNRSPGTLRHQLGIPPGRGFNATVSTDGGRLQSAGETPPDHASVSVGWRVISIDGRTAELRVRTW